MPDAETQEALAAGDARMTTIEQQISEMRTELRANTALTRDIRDFLETGRALFRFGEWFGKVIGVAAAVVLAWAAWAGIRHGGKQ